MRPKNSEDRQPGRRISLPRVSVILPTRDRAHLINKAIGSILRQTFEDYELIIVDDGSSDDTEETVLAFGEPRIRYFKKSHSGAASARNYGLKLSRGEYIAYCDDDCVWSSRHVSESVSFLDSRPEIGMAYADFLVNMPNEKSFLISFDFDKRRLETANFIHPLTVMHRHSCIDKAGSFDERLLTGSDWDMWLRISDFFQISRLPVIAGRHRYYFDTVSLTGNRNKIFDRKQVIQKRVRRAEKNNEISEYIDNCSVGVINNLILSGDLKYAYCLTDDFILRAKNYQTIACRGLCNFAKGDFRAAIETFKKSFALVPKHWRKLPIWHRENILTVKAYLSRAYYNLGKDNVSYRICRDILNVMPQHPDAALQIARCYIKNKRPSSALKMLRSNTERNHICNPEVYNLRGCCDVIKKDYGKAAREFAKAVIIDPQIPLYRYNLAAAYARLGLRGKALAEYEKTTDLRSLLSKIV